MSTTLLWNDGPIQSSLTFECVTKYLHENQAEATEHPVERGADVTDHVRVQNAKLTLEVYVTNTPLGDADSPRPGILLSTPLAPALPDRLPKIPAVLAVKTWNNPINGVGFEAIEPVTVDVAQDAPLPEPFAVQTIQFAAEFDDVQAVREKLLELQRSVQLLQVVTPIEHYTDMVIEHVTMPRDAPEGGASITVTFKQLRIVATKIVAAPVPTEPRGNGAVSKGHQGTKDAKNPEKKKSVLRSLLGGKK